MGDRQRVLARKLDAAGWGLFFIWVGIAVAASLGWGAALLGVGIIMLARQLAGRSLGLPLEGFALVVGVVFCLGGIWAIADRHLGSAVRGALVPVVCIIAGAALLVSALLRRPVDRIA